MHAPTDRLLYAAGLLLGVLPLWVGSHLPMVDLPQHLHLISVLHRLEDPTTLYPQLFAARQELTPYLGYYYTVSLLSWLLPLEAANRLFLSACVAGLPLALAFLLRSLGRAAWPSLLALPLGYGDCFGWGFINYQASLPLGLVCCGLFVRALTQAGQRWPWAAALAVALAATLLFHVQAWLFLALGLPWLLLTTRVPEPAPGPGAWRAWVRPRLPALAGVVPGVALFLAWVVLRLGAPGEVRPGAPWKAWGPVLSPQNLAFKSLAQNRSELLAVLANLLRDETDRWPLVAVGCVAAAALVAGLLAREPGTEGALERWRMAGLAALALGLFFLLPFDIHGHAYYVNTRYAPLAAALALAALPPVRAGLRRPLLAAATGCALLLAVVLGRGFAAFSREASEWEALVGATAPRPRVMGLIFDWGSRVVRHPVYLHSAAVLARARGGSTNFSFALTPHSPLRYRGEPPPTFPSEWQPQAFSYAAQGGAYDHFLVRGRHPAQVFGERLRQELAVAAHSGQSWLVRRR